LDFSFQHLFPLWWSNLVVNTERYVVFAVCTWAVLSLVLRGPLRARKIRGESPAAGQMVTEFLFSIRSIAVFATVALAMKLMAPAGVYPLSDLADHWGPVWFAAALVLMILGHDAFYYWTHRAMHRVAALRGIHARHHRSHNPSPFTAYSFDVREALLMASFVFVWPFVVPTPWAVVPLFIVHQIVRNTLAHAGYELMPARADGRPVLDWLTTATHHDLHHAAPGSNFSLYFTWWDRWMGTENPDYHAAFARAVRRTTPVAGAPAPSTA